MVSRDWWIRYRHNAAIKGALRRSYSRHLWRVVRQHVEKSGSYPPSFPKLFEALGIAQGTDHRKKTGAIQTSRDEVLGIATLLGTETAELMPANRKWLVSVTRDLCWDSNQLDIELFVDYCLSQILKHRDRGERGLREWNTEESDVKELIRSIGSQVDATMAQRSIESVASKISRHLEGEQ